MKNPGLGFVLFPFAWGLGAWREGEALACQIGPFGFVLSGLALRQGDQAP